MVGGWAHSHYLDNRRREYLLCDVVSRFNMRSWVLSALCVTLYGLMFHIYDPCMTYVWYVFVSHPYVLMYVAGRNMMCYSTVFLWYTEIFYDSMISCTVMISISCSIVVKQYLDFMLLVSSDCANLLSGRMFLYSVILMFCIIYQSSFQFTSLRCSHAWYILYPHWVFLNTHNLVLNVFIGCSVVDAKWSMNDVDAP